jgi:hypothetical protein
VEGDKRTPDTNIILLWRRRGVWYRLDGESKEIEGNIGPSTTAKIGKSRGITIES